MHRASRQAGIDRDHFEGRGGRNQLPAGLEHTADRTLKRFVCTGRHQYLLRPDIETLGQMLLKSAGLGITDDRADIELRDNLAECFLLLR